MEEHPVAPPGAVHQDMDAQEHADKTEPHEMAPVHKLPDVTLMSVHYPGFVKNTDRALHTLRGEATVSKVFIFFPPLHASASTSPPPPFP